MTEFAVRFVASAMNNILPCKGQRLRKRLARQLLPYCGVQIEGNVVLLLNRNYKPLGWPDEDRSYLEYEDRQFYSLRFIPLHEPKFVTKPDGQRFVYFYGGETGPGPWVSAAAADEYRARIAEFFGDCWGAMG